jgi:hypothetical protein
MDQGKERRTEGGRKEGREGGREGTGTAYNLKVSSGISLNKSTKRA